MNGKLNEFQAEFRRGYANSTVNNIFCLNGISRLKWHDGEIVNYFFVESRILFVAVKFFKVLGRMYENTTGMENVFGVL